MEKKSKGMQMLQKVARCFDESENSAKRINKREASETEAWLCVIPIGCSLNEYYYKDSAYNNVWQLEERMQKLEKLSVEVEDLKNTSRIVKGTMELVQGIGQRLDRLEETLPASTWRVIQQGIEINSQNIFLQNIACRLLGDGIDLRALFKLSW